MTFIMNRYVKLIAGLNYITNRSSKSGKRMKKKKKKNRFNTNV